MSPSAVARLIGSISIVSLFILALSGPTALAAEFHDEVERDFPLRTMKDLQVTNLRGGMVIQGWALDKIRIKARRRAVAETEADAKKMLNAVDFRFRENDEGIELSAEYGRGLEIGDRLRERESPQTSMEMVVFAPAKLRLRVWTMSGDVTVKSWKAPFEVRTSTGPIRIESIKADSIALLCPSCPITAIDVRGSLRCMGSTGKVDLKNIEGETVFAETNSGSISLSRVYAAEHLYVTRTGAIAGRDFKGHLEFHTQKGDVVLEEGSGFVSGKTDRGNISIKMREWRFSDKALIESVKGNIALYLPVTFAAEVDLWSMNGKASLGFPLQPLDRGAAVGPVPLNHLRGRIGEGGDQLKVHSQNGNIQILKNR